MEFWRHLWSGEGFMPRRYCGIWDPSLISLHVVSDVTIWLAYLWIPLVMLWAFLGHRKALRFHRPTLLILLLYVVFITACGWTHFFDALMFYNPVYRINGLLRALTAAASLATAVSLVRLVPLVITAPVTILAQQGTMRQQFAWLRDILDGVTAGRLRLCETTDDLPRPLGAEPMFVTVTDSEHLGRVRRLVQKLAREAGFAPVRTYDLVTAAHEAAMNALKHGGSAAQVRGYAAADAVQVWIEDAGPGIPLDQLPISTLKQGYSTAGTAGQGWFMILSFVEKTYLRTGSGGTLVVLEMTRATQPDVVPFGFGVGGDIAAAA